MVRVVYAGGMTAVPDTRVAPGRLELVRAFVNTLDLDLRSEALESPAATAAWLAAAGLIPLGMPLSPADQARVIEAREALRSLLLAHATGEAGADALEQINRIADRARLRLHLATPMTTAIGVDSDGTDAALGVLVAIVFEAIAGDTWTRLKVCPSETCRWAFFDGSKNRSSRWCSMRDCGARAKRETFRRRHGRTAQAAGPS